MAEAVGVEHGENPLRIVKWAPAAVAAVAPLPARAIGELDRFTASGYRTIAVACGPSRDLTLIGLIACSDPPRADSKQLLGELRSLGGQPIMVSGDAPATAATVARAIGLDGAICPAGEIPASISPADYAVYAGVFPEDKFRLVKAFQQQGHAVGMCGDGANDAPALRQAQMGIAVSTATDVAKAAAGIVLTEPGLGGIVACISEGRSAFQPVLTYTLSLLVNKSVNLIVLGAGLIMTGHAVLTPMLQALSMVAGDVVTMSRAADRARPTSYPSAWRMRNLTLAAIPLAVFKLSYCIGILAAGWFAAAGLERDAYPTARHAGFCRPGEHLRAAHQASVLAVAARESHGVGITRRRGADCGAGDNGAADERVAADRACDARVGDVWLCGGDGCIEAAGIQQT